MYEFFVGTHKNVTVKAAFLQDLNKTLSAGVDNAGFLQHRKHFRSQRKDFFCSCHAGVQQILHGGQMGDLVVHLKLECLCLCIG